MKRLNFVSLMVLALFVSACAHRFKLLDTSAVSMTKHHVQKGYVLKEIGEVEDRYCYGDDPVVSNSTDVGLMDEAIMKAQKQKKADFLSNVSFYSEGMCMVVQGTAMKLVKNK